MLFVDLVNFKVVNDSLGCGVGRRLLVEMAERLESSQRPADTLARMGGDEFAVMLTNVRGIREALASVERILKRLEEPVALQGEEITVTASIGVAFDASLAAGFVFRRGLARNACRQARAAGRSIARDNMSHQS